MKPQTVYRIINRKTGEAIGNYSRSHGYQYNFDSVSEARNAYCCAYEDTEKFAIAKYRIVYELIDPDCGSKLWEVWTHGGPAESGLISEKIGETEADTWEEACMKVMEPLNDAYWNPERPTMYLGKPLCKNREEAKSND